MIKIVDRQEIEKVIAEIILKELGAFSEPGEGSRPMLSSKPVPIGVSARHVHLTEIHVEKLFGRGHRLTFKKELMGGQFAAEEQVTIVGAKLRAIENVRVLGPVRKASQVEVSPTDAIKLGIAPPVRDSGDLAHSCPISIVGPKGAVFLEEGCILARRHIHMSPKDAAAFGLNDRDVVRASLEGVRGGILDQVLVRVDPSFTLEMHMDTDEANGLGIQTGDLAILIK